MKLFYLFLCLNLATFNSAFAQSDDYSEQDPKAVELLSKVSNKLNNYNTLKIDFNLFVEDLHDSERASYKGSALYKKGYYKLDLMGQIVFSDGQTNWTYLVDAEEVNITDNIDEEDNIVDPKKLLSNFREEYKIRLISDKFEKNRPLVEIDLYPFENEGKKYSRIVLKIDKVQNQIYSIRYVGKDGVNYLIELFSFIENADINDSEIKFRDDLFPDAEIIDMRF